MRRALVCSFVVAVSLCLVSGARADEKKAAAPAKKAAAAPKFKTVAASEMKWTDSAEIKGAQSVVFWGDPKKGEYGQINKWPGGTDVGWHTHTNRIHGVVVSGTLVIEPEGQPAKELTAGSYIDDPGKLKHKTSCKAGADCVFFIHQHGAFDFIPSEEKK
jgi:quercetin dioxygenase-like cupin family protein